MRRRSRFLPWVSSVALAMLVVAQGCRDASSVTPSPLQSIDSGDLDSPSAAPADVGGDGGCAPGERACRRCSGAAFCANTCPLYNCASDASARSDSREPLADASLDVTTADVTDDSVSSDAPSDASNTPCFDSSETIQSALKACASDGDCTYIRHITDCLGNGTYLGVAKGSATLAASCEMSWEAQLPHPPTCDGHTPVVTTEDGKSDTDGASPSVRCAAMSSGSVCQTYL